MLLQPCLQLSYGHLANAGTEIVEQGLKQLADVMRLAFFSSHPTRGSLYACVYVYFVNDSNKKIDLAKIILRIRSGSPYTLNGAGSPKSARIVVRLADKPHRF